MYRSLITRGMQRAVAHHKKPVVCQESRMTTGTIHPAAIARRWNSDNHTATSEAVAQPSSSSAASAGNSSQGDETHFGFNTVPKHQKEELVGDVFHRVADSYDKMNDVMSVGIHRLWKDYFVNQLDPYPGTVYLDVAGGTGDIAFRILEGIKRREVSTMSTASSQVMVCDINPSMLRVGKDRSTALGYEDRGISWVTGSAEELPVDDESIDAYTIAFGIRNVTTIENALEEAYRVLVPGGRFMCLEFSQVPNPVIRKLYDTYSFEAIPVFGELVAGDMASYQYLVESIRKFPNQEKFKGMIEDAGFSLVTYENLTLGVTAIHSGYKL